MFIASSIAFSGGLRGGTKLLGPLCEPPSHCRSVDLIAWKLEVVEAFEASEGVCQVIFGCAAVGCPRGVS